MPRYPKKKGSKKTSKKPYARRYTKRRSRKMVWLSRPFPNILRTKMRVVSDLIAYAPAATTGEIKISVNSAYDPFGTAGNDQPRYYAELSTLYGYYICRYAVARMTIINTTSDLLEIGSSVRASGYEPTSVRMAAEDGKYQIVGATDENMSNKCVIVQKFSLSKLKGGAEAIASPVGNNPGFLYYFVLRLSSANNVIVNYRVELIQWVEFSLQKPSAVAEHA